MVVTHCDPTDSAVVANSKYKVRYKGHRAAWILAVPEVVRGCFLEDVEHLVNPSKMFAISRSDVLISSDQMVITAAFAEVQYAC